jgi:acyl carrier protein
MTREECDPPIRALVRGLVAEVHPHAKRPSVTLDSTFDNLGIGSLGLAELLLRVQDKFGVALPPHILAGAETPRELLAAVARGHPAVREDGGNQTRARRAKCRFGSLGGAGHRMTRALVWEGRWPGGCHHRRPSTFDY